MTRELTDDSASAWVVVPCYNEARRLDTNTFSTFLAKSGAVRLLFVNDGSVDDTGRLLDALAAAHPHSASVLHLSRNQGKGEAVRQGLLKAISQQPRYVGYWDADLATPLPVIYEFLEIFGRYPAIEIVFGARIKLLGRHIVRNELRHYAGRVFATTASMVLSVPIYDTQCGAKLFVVTPDLAGVFANPFVARWVFDVELLARVQRLRASQPHRRVERILYEYPLYEWRDIAGSKVRTRDFFRAGLDLLTIKLKYPVPRLHRGEASLR